MWELQNPKIGSDKTLALRKPQQKKKYLQQNHICEPSLHSDSRAQMQQCAKGIATISSPDKLPWERKN